MFTRLREWAQTQGLSHPSSSFLAAVGYPRTSACQKSGLKIQCMKPELQKHWRTCSTCLSNGGIAPAANSSKAGSSSVGTVQHPFHHRLPDSGSDPLNELAASQTGLRNRPSVKLIPMQTIKMRSSFSLTLCKAQVPHRPPTTAPAPSVMASSQCT